MMRKFKNYAHLWQALIASLLNGEPAKKIKTIGVTGTDGKTTTSSLIYHILSEAGIKTALISTVAARIDDKTYGTGLHTTTPSAFTLQKYIKRAVDAGSEFLVLEITSHALDQNRAHGVNFKIGVLTNITHEHLDYHRSYENYLRAKARLFERSEISILNRDDESFDKISSFAKNSKILAYSLKNPKADFNLKSIGVKFPEEFEFNQENFLAAVAVAQTLGVQNEQIAAALTTFKFPAGRQEIVYEKDFKIVIDFAHTPNSFSKVLPALKRTTEGRLIHVFGSAGKRDASKRPLMGSIAAKNDDVIILTAEDPRSELIENINSQIKLGIKEFDGELIEIEDRQKAINEAVRLASKGDTIIITGKGHEQSMNLGHGEITWSDHAAVEKALQAVR